MNQLYLATFYRDNPYGGITAEAYILNQHDAEEWYRTKQSDFGDAYTDAKDDEDNDDDDLLEEEEEEDDESDGSSSGAEESEEADRHGGSGRGEGLSCQCSSQSIRGGCRTSSAGCDSRR